jgi:hypothetical protein
MITFAGSNDPNSNAKDNSLADSETFDHGIADSTATKHTTASACNA